MPTSNKDTFTAGTADRTDKFGVDNTAGTKADADVISGFEDHIDKITLEGGTKVIWWKKDGGDTLLYSENDHTTAVDSSTKILALLTGFAGDIDPTDFEGASVVTAEVKAPTDVVYTEFYGSHTGNYGTPDRFVITQNRSTIDEFEDHIDKISLSQQMLGQLTDGKIWAKRDSGVLKLYTSQSDANANAGNFLVEVDMTYNPSIDENDFESGVIAFEIV